MYTGVMVVSTHAHENIWNISFIKREWLCIRKDLEHNLDGKATDAETLVAVSGIVKRDGLAGVRVGGGGK